MWSESSPNILNPQIALETKIPAITPLGDYMNQAADTAHKAQENALLVQQTKGASLDVQQKQMDLQDQQNYKRAWMDASGDPDKAEKLAMQYGVGPKTIIAARKSMMDAATARAKLQGDQFDNQAKQNDLLNGIFAPVEAETDPMKQSAAWDAAVRTGVQRGIIAPQEAAQHPYPGPDGVKQYRAMLTTDKWITAQAAQTRAQAAQTQAQTGANRLAAELPGIQTGAQLKGEELLAKQRSDAATDLSNSANQAEYDQKRGAMPYQVVKVFPLKFDKQAVLDAALTPEQRTTEGQKAQEIAGQAAGRAETKSYHQSELAMRNAEIGVQRGRLSVEQQRYGFEASGGVSPAAQMAADGRMDPQTLRMMVRSNPGIIGQIRAVDPNFDMANVDKRYETLKEFTNTSVAKAGGQALALNTLIHHADLYMQAAEAMKNRDWRPGNAAYNAVASAFGAAPPTNAALIGRFFASETGKVATGGVPAEGEINGVLKNLSTSSSPDQIAGAGKTLLQIAAGRATPLIERVKDAHLDGMVRVIGPDAQGILARRGFDPNTMKPAGAVLPRGNGRTADAGVIQQYLGANGNDKDKTRKALTDAGWVIPKAQ